MDEVSIRMFQFYVDLASLNGFTAEQLTSGMSRANELLTRRRRWLNWDEYVQIITRFEALLGSPERAEDAFRDGTFRQVVRPFNAVVSYFTTARAVYWAGARWFAPSLYRHLKFEQHEVDRDALLLRVELPEPYEPSEVFWRHWRGSMRFAPLQIGLPESQVTLQHAGRRAEYLIRLPQRRQVLARLRAWTRAVVRSTDVVDELSRHQHELREAYESLVDAYAQSEAALRVSETTRRALLDSLPDLIVVLDGEDVVQSIQGSSRHPLNEQMWGLLDRPLSALSEALPGATAELTATLLEQLRNVRSTAAPHFVEFAIAQAAELLHFECRASLLEDRRVLFVIRDVSDRKRLSSQLLLSDRMASLGTLAAAVAHEINNPLASLLNNLEVLDQPALLQPAQGETLRDAKEAGQQIREIVGQLRMFTRPDTEELKPIDVNALLESMLRMTSHRIRHSATVVRSFGNVPHARADQARLGQVFVNLLVNAVQAMPGGDLARNQLHVRTARTDSGEVLVEIRDTGRGIAPELLPRIFDPFFTTKSLNDGTGLGLAICQRIVSDLGGRIEVDSELGIGSTFRVLLAPAGEPAEPPVRAASTPVPLVSRRRRVLVVDDNARLGLSLKLLLRDHDVTVVHHGIEGVNQLLSENFEVALCDLMMPDVDGMELYRRVRQAKPGLEERIVFMTGGAFTGDARTFLSSVKNTCLQKPFRAEELEALLAKA